MRPYARLALASALAFAVHASGESPVCIGGDLDHLSAVQKETCNAAAAQVRSMAAAFHAPEDWHFYVICTNADWNMYASFSSRAESQLADFNADTDLQKHTTFLRGEQLLGTDKDAAARLVAHEIAMAVLKTSDEAQIQQKVASWLPATAANAPVLTASR